MDTRPVSQKLIIVYTYEGGPLDGQVAERTSVRGKGYTKIRDRDGRPARYRDARRNSARGWYYNAGVQRFDLDALTGHAVYRYADRNFL